MLHVRAGQPHLHRRQCFLLPAHLRGADSRSNRSPNPNPYPNTDPNPNPNPNPSPNPNPNPNPNHPQVGGPTIRLCAVWLFVLGSLIFFVGALIDLLVVLRAAAAERGSRRRALRTTSSMDHDARA